MFIENQTLKQLMLDNYACEIAQDVYLQRLKLGLMPHEKTVLMKVNKKNKILDLGCGTGRVALALGKLGYTNVTGIDFVPKMIELAKKQSKAEKVNYIVGDATNLKIENKFFDVVVFSNNGWSQIPGSQNRYKALEEIYRVLKKDGIFIFSALAFRKTPYMILKWLKFKIAKSLNIKIYDLDFGDTILYRYNDFKKCYYRRFPKIGKQKASMKIYMHYSSLSKIKKQLKSLGFKIQDVAMIEKKWDWKQYHFVCKK